MGRLDYFLIWAHGISHRYDILAIIRAEFKILGIYRKQVGNIRNFVRDLYACDTVPFRHLKLKTHYLLSLDPEVIFILVQNDAPEEKMVGQGAFKHLQCMRVGRVKAKIRSKFNEPGTENHVVHASDYESQVKHAMKLLGIKRQKLPSGGLRAARLDDLRANILGVGKIEVENTPHYKFVCGIRQPYAKYYDRYMGTRLTDDHTVEAFDHLIANFKMANRIKVKGNLIIDGVHRAAILKHRGATEIEVEDVSI